MDLNEELGEEMDEYTDAILGIVGEFLRKLSENEEIIESIALTQKKLYDSYIEVGFTEEQALNILGNMLDSLSENVDNL